MDEKSIDDQFSKLHPCFPPRTRIAIVGAGPSGLSAAYALCKLGYSDVTVFEKHHSPGGMCESVEIGGKIYDLGGQVLAANSAPSIFHLAQEVGIKTEEMDTHKFALINSSNGALSEMKLVEDYVSMISLTLKLQDKAKASGRIGVHAVSEIAPELAPDYFKNQGFPSVPKSVIYGYTASGYGYVHDMPYAYIHEFTRTSMAGKIRRFKGGYTSLWKKLSQMLPIELCSNMEVLSVKRDSSDITVEFKTENGDIKWREFDKIIISGNFPFNSGKTYRSPSLNTADTVNNCIDLSELEKELFSKVETIDYYTTVLNIKGFEHIPKGFYYFDEFMDDPSTIGNPVAMQRFYGDTDVFLFWSYGNSDDIQEKEVADFAIAAVKRMGGEVERVILQRKFKYFPHVNSEDMKEGFYDKLEFLLQGQRNTFFVGGLMAFELTERNANYAFELIRKHFSNDNQEPNYPYVQRLLTLKPNNGDLVPRQLEESPGVEFPELFTLDAYLRYWGTHRVTQRKTLYTWINEKGHVVAQRTYNELHSNASKISEKLMTCNNPTIKKGDRVLLIYIPGLDFVDAFFGCLRAGVIPVPAIPPDPLQKTGQQALLHVSNISKACNAVAILSTVSYHIAVKASSARSMLSFKGNDKGTPRWPDLPWLHTDYWVKKSRISANVEKYDEPSPRALCFLQFTSGSTADPKGVMISHGGLMHNVKMMRRRYKSTSNTILVSWLPQYHDMGLIGGLFTSMVSGGSAILFSPMAFIQNPLLWLQTLSNYRATHSAGPNFAFELIIRRLEADDRAKTFDLSSMVFLMVAAEPIRAATMRKFLELTQSFGLCRGVMAPGYGLAENCVYVCSAYGEGEEIFVDWEDRVCCGYINDDDDDDEVRIKIVDRETGEEHKKSGKEGEVWISSPSGGVGYWNNEELSRETFENELNNHRAKKYIRTGDLGRIVEGKLFVTGRIKDLIIVSGRNIYSSDIEKTVESSCQLVRPGCCAAVGVPKEILLSKGNIQFSGTSDQVGLVVIAEVREVAKSFVKEAIRQIQTCVAEEHGIIVASVVLIKPRTISKTTSGKIKRYECLKKFADGTLDIVDQSKENATEHQSKRTHTPTNSDVTKSDIVNFLIELLSQMTGVSIAKISITESLVSYGVDSIGVVRAAQKLSDFLGVPVGAIDIFTATCIDDLAKFSENLLKKSRPNSAKTKAKVSSTTTAPEASYYRKMEIWSMQILALAYVCFLLMFPAYLSISAFAYLSYTTQTNTCIAYLISLFCAPLSWMLCIFSTCICIGFLGTPFLQTNYALYPEVSIWSSEFVKWWALHKAQEISSKVLAVHLRGTVFLNYWFRMLGANVPSSALLDTIDITDPFLVSIGEDAVLAEGALVQSHEVRNGILSFYPTRIGTGSSVGPYALLQKSVEVEDGDEVPALTSGGDKTTVEKGKIAKQIISKNCGNYAPIIHFLGIYTIGFLGSLSAAVSYFLYLNIMQKPPTMHHFVFICVSGAFHWLPHTIVAYIVILDSPPSNPIAFAVLIALAYTTYGIILACFTCFLKSHLEKNQDLSVKPFEKWLIHRILTSSHIRFAKFLSGTEAFCSYLRQMGAKIGNHCSIRAINPVLDPELVSLSDGVHLGDFSRLIPGYYTSQGYLSGGIEIQDNAVIGSQGIILPCSVLEKDVILGALSVAPSNRILQRGGVYVGSPAPSMVKSTVQSFDERIEEMDIKYRKVLGNLAANLAATTLKVKSRYFHRIGAAGKGSLRLYDCLPNLPHHKIFSPGKNYTIVIRHSNCLSSDDDARLDPRGAAIRIAEDNFPPLLDLTLKTGNAFHARTIGDFATWLVCGAAAREEHVKYYPHIRDAMWGSLRRADSYTELHYYSNITRLFRFEDGQEMYVKFKLRPLNKTISEDNGKVEPIGKLPPETGAIPRDENDKRPLLFLADDFQRRVNSHDGVHYVLQLQIRPVPDDEKTREIALDCTRPWDEAEFPHFDVGEITIDRILTKEESEELEFNPFLRCSEVDVIRASSCNQSASMDHGRSLVYAICQHLRNKKPLPDAWRTFLNQSDVKIDLSGCPMAAQKTQEKTAAKEVTLARHLYVTLWLMSAQPFLQIFLPYFLMGLVIFAPMNFTFHFKKISKKQQMHFLLPFFWICSGVLAGLVCALSKWILVGKKKEGENEAIWSLGIFMDTIWQAVRTLVGDYFMEMTGGSFIFNVWMNLMGSDVAWDRGAYVDTMGAVLNPELMQIEEYGSVGREALLFGHIYEGEDGKVKYGKIIVKKGGFVGSRAVAMPGVTVGRGGSLGALSLGMKEEFVN